MDDLTQIRDALLEDGRFRAKINADGLLVVHSDEWSELSSGRKPDVVYASKTPSGRIDIRPVGGDEAFDRSIEGAITYIKELCN